MRSADIDAFADVGATREIGTIDDYALTSTWAVAADHAGFTGLRYFPRSPAATEAMGDALTDTDHDVVDFLTAITPELTGTPAVQPMGTADAQNTFTRLLTDVRFGTTTPAEAAEATIAEVNGMVAG